MKFFAVILSISFFLSVVESKDCWDTTWYNHNHPSHIIRSEFELLPRKPALDQIRTSICIGQSLKAQCSDMKGELYPEGTWSNHASKFRSQCSIEFGIICHPFNGTTTEMCPDLKIRVGCICPITTTVTLYSTTHRKSKTSTTVPTTGNPTSTALATGKLTTASIESLTTSSTTYQTTASTENIPIPSTLKRTTSSIKSPVTPMIQNSSKPFTANTTTSSIGNSITTNTTGNGSGPAENSATRALYNQRLLCLLFYFALYSIYM